MTKQEDYIIWAALLAMVHDVHGAQDNLTEEQWTIAESIYTRLNNELEKGKADAAPTELKEASNMPEDNKNKNAAIFWTMAFGEKVDNVEAGYHAWQLRQDETRRNQKPEKAEELRARIQFARDYYNAARADLSAWVIAHPAPSGTADL